VVVLSVNNTLPQDRPSFKPFVKKAKLKSMFLLISAVAHFYLATIGYPRYVADLKRGMNRRGAVRIGVEHGYSPGRL